MIALLKKILPILLKFLPGLFRSISLAMRERKKQKVLGELGDAIDKAENTKDTSDLENIINITSHNVYNNVSDIGMRNRDEDPPEPS